MKKMRKMKNKRIVPIVLAVGLCGAAALAAEPELVMFGGDASRNMVSGEKGLASKWDPKTGLNMMVPNKKAVAANKSGGMS